MMVPVVVVLLCILLIPYSTSPAAADSSTGNIITLPGCPATCGNISNIFYPFGIKPGCFRSGYQLNCTHDKLFLGDSNGTVEVTSIDISGGVSINAPIFTMSAEEDHNITYWKPLIGESYVVNYYTTFNVVGCGFNAYVADSVTGNVMGMCSSVCANNNSDSDSDFVFVGSDPMSGNGYCSVSIITDSTTSSEEYVIRLDRLHRGDGRATGKAFLTVYYEFSKDDLISSDLIGGSSVVPLNLRWAIRDQSSCIEAKRNISTYACSSDHSYCFDDSTGDDDSFKGYLCNCLSWLETVSSGIIINTIFNTTDGNPYISGGCPAPRVNNKKDCLRTCGNISVPYPFGLVIECARDDTFWLQCRNDHPPQLIFNNQFQVTEILVEEGQLQILDDKDPNDGSLQINYFIRSQPTIMLDWVVDYMSCEDAKKITNFACSYNHSECLDLKNFKYNYNNSHGPTYRCKCSLGYQGNPYTDPGCQDINECNYPEKYNCSAPSTCINYVGSFDCLPPSGSSGFKRGILIGVTVAIGFPLIILSIIFIYWRWKKISLKRVREKHFHKNRGLLLQQLISSDNDIAERTRIFSFDELAKATDKFDEARVLGRGGHGTVFKGILSDQRVIAIKKSKINVQNEIDQFLNEVVILSQINHRNIVKLFGCCLETEVPLLVYEFVSNGTLSDHLHHPDRRSSLSWEDRLSIARDVSGALAYLHSAASISIFHRDVKSANILLDDYCTAKVSDFGASRSIPLDMTHVVTVVQGTFGYLDPEYYHTGQLTEKSDVYSFGVILVELLTGEKPISFTRPEEERNLCTHFLSAFRDGRLSQIVEARVMEEATGEEIDTICRLADTCLRLSGEDRPTMKRVEVSLEGLRRNKTRKRHPRKEPKDDESASLLPSTAQYGNYPEPTRAKEIPGGSNVEEQSMLSITLPR